MKQLFEAYSPKELVKTERILNTPSEFAKRALFYVQETGYLKSLESHLSDRSKLNSYLFLIVLSGKGTFTYKDKTYVLNQNDCAFIHCMEHYTHISSKEAPWELLWVHFNGITAGEYYQYFISTSDNIFHVESLEEYVHLIYQLLQVHQKKEASWELISTKLITDLLTNCIINRHNRTLPEGVSIIHKLYTVKDYLDQNFQSKILLDDLADSFYISKYHLCREYKKIFRITILDYLTVKRITHAKEMLRFTKLSIEEIALDSGYPDASYFNKVFHKIENMSASEYRRTW